MEKKPVKTAEQIEAEKAEAERLIGEIQTRINKVPRSVIEGDVRKAQSWKEKAFEAMRLSQNKAPRLQALRDAADDLRAFG
ncbi:hypothetical protein ACVCII_04145 [Burkholderia glumae]|uniref:hypothetical protein n=1 Tax=Burkholderia glumae TaxID=337 RepID=UPI0020375C7D|nr:hypothetical protein [Burkholderia glumae]MCM2546173.1 hypothetical protein [Burkholderia glumae]